MTSNRRESNVIPFPLAPARIREQEDLDLLMFPPVPAETPDRMALDALALLADGMARLNLLAETHPQELAALTTLDPALGEVDSGVRRLRLQIERHRLSALRHG